MVRTRIQLLPREIAGRVSRSFVATGYLHALYLERCDSRLRKPLSQSVKWSLFHYFPVRRGHPAYRSRLLSRPARGNNNSQVVTYLVEIADEGKYNQG